LFVLHERENAEKAVPVRVRYPVVHIPEAISRVRTIGPVATVLAGGAAITFVTQLGRPLPTSRATDAQLGTALASRAIAPSGLAAAINNHGTAILQGGGR
jgi:hypothetical protein